MKYTKEYLMKNYLGKFINIYGTYNFQLKRWEFELRGVSNEIRENYESTESAFEAYV